MDIIYKSIKYLQMEGYETHTHTLTFATSTWSSTHNNDFFVLLDLPLKNRSGRKQTHLCPIVIWCMFLLNKITDSFSFSYYFSVRPWYPIKQSCWQQVCLYICICVRHIVGEFIVNYIVDMDASKVPPYYVKDCTPC